MIIKNYKLLKKVKIVVGTKLIFKYVLLKIMLTNHINR